MRQLPIDRVTTRRSVRRSTSRQASEGEDPTGRRKRTLYELKQVAAMKDKVALVTGASSGIGKATAVMLGTLGAKVIVASLANTGGEEVATQIEKAGGKARFVPTDVSKSVDCERAVKAAVETFGRLDVAMN